MISRIAANRSTPSHARLVLGLLATLWPVFVGYPAEGQTTGYSIADDLLVEIDLETGTSTTVGSVGTFRFSGLTMDSEGFLWGVSRFTGDLWRIDPADASSLRIGMLDVPVGVEAGLTMDACGTLWMLSDRVLSEVDTTTATSTVRAVVSEDVAALTSSGDQLIGMTSSGSNRLARIDSATGEIEEYGDEISFGAVHVGMDFDASGRLWGVFWNDIGIIPLWVSSILRLHPTTGQIESTLTLPEADVDPIFEGNLAVSLPIGLCDSPIEEIPIDDPTGLAVLACLIAATAVLTIRRT